MSDGTDNTTQSSEKEGDGDDQSLYFQEQAEVIHDLAGLLVHNVLGDDRFWRFQAMAFHAANAFGDVPDMNLFDSIRSEEGRGQLLSNPAAAPLLAYFIYALQRFNWDIAEDELAEAKTEERCRMLARAFSLLGRRGERPPQRGEAGYFSLEFDAMILQAQKGLGLPEGEPMRDADRKRVVRDALRLAFRRRYGGEYESAHPQDKERMRKLRDDLTGMGYDLTG